MQVKVSVGLRRAVGPNENVCAVVGLQLVSRVGREGAVPVDQPPIGAEVQDLSCFSNVSVFRQYLSGTRLR